MKNTSLYSCNSGGGGGRLLWLISNPNCWALIGALLIGGSTAEAQRGLRAPVSIQGELRGEKPVSRTVSRENAPDIEILKSRTFASHGRKWIIEEAKPIIIADSYSVGKWPKLSEAELRENLRRPEVQQAVREIQETKTGFITVTVVDRQASWISWAHRGETYAAWSSVDFNHLTGFTRFSQEDRNYVVMLAVNNVDSTDPDSGTEYRIPAKIADLDGEYVLYLGDPQNKEAVEVIETLHELYAQQGQRLRNAYEKRMAQKAELLANPPAPKDPVIRLRRIIRANAAEQKGGVR